MVINKAYKSIGFDAMKKNQQLLCSIVPIQKQIQDCLSLISGGLKNVQYDFKVFKPFSTMDYLQAKLQISQSQTIFSYV